MKAVVAAFNQEKALVGAFSVITNFRMELFGALGATQSQSCRVFTINLYKLLRKIIDTFAAALQAVLRAAGVDRERRDGGQRARPGRAGGEVRGAGLRPLLHPGPQPGPVTVIAFVFTPYYR